MSGVNHFGQLDDYLDELDTYLRQLDSRVADLERLIGVGRSATASRGADSGVGGRGADSGAGGRGAVPDLPRVSFSGPSGGSLLDRMNGIEANLREIIARLS